MFSQGMGEFVACKRPLTFWSAFVDVMSMNRVWRYLQRDNSATAIRLDEGSLALVPEETVVGLGA